jgi:cellulose 1,4-beta-cellobiosidase
VSVAALAVAIGGGTAMALSTSGAQAATTTLCQEETSPVSGGTYTVQNNEFDSGASECVGTDGNADFTVANSSIGNATDGSPGAYPSIYQGCHWGNCSSGGLTSTPIQVADLTAGTVTTSWSTSQPGGSSDYDVAYDIWFNQTPTTSGQPNCAEMMVWLNHNGSVQPFGSQVASGISLGGHTYDVWEGGQSFGDTVTYDMTTAATSVSNLDVGTLAQDAVSRGYISRSCYLIDVEAGFELWQGGAGLATDSFSVNVAGAGSSPGPRPGPAPPPPPPPPHPDPDPDAHPHPHAADDRLRRVLGQLLDDVRVARRLRGADHRHQHRLQRTQWLEPRLDLPRRPGDQQPVERQRHPVRRGGDGQQRLL